MIIKLLEKKESYLFFQVLMLSKAKTFHFWLGQVVLVFRIKIKILIMFVNKISGIDRFGNYGINLRQKMKNQLR
tara:strand:- start:500 stop:721 length:222 start_codon:yes stop_codon:yes gene_type:complete